MPRAGGSDDRNGFSSNHFRRQKVTSDDKLQKNAFSAARTQSSKPVNAPLEKTPFPKSLRTCLRVRDAKAFVGVTRRSPRAGRADRPPPSPGESEWSASPRPCPRSRRPPPRVSAKKPGDAEARCPPTDGRPTRRRRLRRRRENGSDVSSRRRIPPPWLHAARPSSPPPSPRRRGRAYPLRSPPRRP